MQVLYELCHFDGGLREFAAFVEFFWVDAVDGLLLGEGGDDAENNGGVGLKGCVHEAAVGLGAHVLKMRGVAFYHDAKGDDGIWFVFFDEDFGGEGGFEGAGYAYELDIVLFDAVFQERFVGIFIEDAAQGVVESGKDNGNVEVGAVEILRAVRGL